MRTRIWKLGMALAAGTLVAVMVADAAVAGVPDADSGVQLAAAETKKKKMPGKRIYGPRGGFGCIACHGSKGRGSKAMEAYPAIAGQDEKYIIRQIKDIISGKRVGGLNTEGKVRTAGMKGALVTSDGEPRISEQKIKDVAEWLSSLKPAKPTPPETPVDAGRLEEGRKLFKELKCLTCHGKEGRKPLKKYPYLAGQKRPYIVTQIKDIRDKKRTNGKSKLMYANVKKITDEQVEILADYLSQIDRTAK